MSEQGYQIDVLTAQGLRGDFFVDYPNYSVAMSRSSRQALFRHGTRTCPGTQALKRTSVSTRG